jgi:hypothetical protein
MSIQWLWRELRFKLKWWRHPTVRAIVSPHPAPPAAVERLRARVISGDWESPQPEACAGGAGGGADPLKGSVLAFRLRERDLPPMGRSPSGKERGE